MPYLFVYDDTIPAGSDFLSQGDDAIREFKDAIKERLESFFTGIDVDPLLPKDGSVPGSAIAEGTLPGTAFDPALNLKTILLLGATWNMVAPAVGSWTTQTYTITGAEPGDSVFVQLIDTPGFFTTAAKVTAADTVSVAFYNLGPGTPSGAVNFYIAVIKPGVPGALHGDLTPTIPFTEFQPADATVGAVYNITEVVPAATASLKLYASITVPAGDVIASAAIRVRDDNTAVVTGTLFKVNAGVSASLGTFTAVVGGGAQTLTISPAYHVVTGDEFVFEIILNSTGSTNANDARLFWASLTLA